MLRFLRWSWGRIRCDLEGLGGGEVELCGYLLLILGENKGEVL